MADKIIVPARQYADLRALLAEQLVQEEHGGTAQLMEQLAPAGARGYLTYDEFFAICCWKEPRQRMRRHWKRNGEPVDAPVLETIIKTALAATDERERMTALLQLHGVGIPVASAILTILEPERYGVIDVRAWQVLHRYERVATNPDGRNFTLDEWLAYIAELRHWATQLGVSARRIEHSLYLYHWKVKLTKIDW